MYRPTPTQLLIEATIASYNEMAEAYPMLKTPQFRYKQDRCYNASLWNLSLLIAFIKMENEHKAEYEYLNEWHPAGLAGVAKDMCTLTVGVNRKFALITHREFFK